MWVWRPLRGRRPAKPGHQTQLTPWLHILHGELLDQEHEVFMTFMSFTVNAFVPYFAGCACQRMLMIFQRPSYFARCM